LRSHIADEGQLLREIGKSEAGTQRARKRKRPKPPAVKRKVSLANRREGVLKETPWIPYTMEPHPEL